MSVRPKKHLGQHFLHDQNIARKIAETLTGYGHYTKVLEIGPGTGALTKFLLEDKRFEVSVMDVDDESIEYLHAHFPELNNRIHHQDFLRADLSRFYQEPFAVTGNFPYNISSQILFKVLENKEMIPEVTGMFQKEMAQRVAEGPGSKVYGITSVLIQAFYKVEYLFTVNENVFTPPPKVKSGVIRLQRLEEPRVTTDHKLFIQVVKTCFNQRRKTIRNSLKPLVKVVNDHPYLEKRPEQLSIEQFNELTAFVKSERELQSSQ